MVFVLSSRESQKHRRVPIPWLIPQMATVTRAELGQAKTYYLDSTPGLPWGWQEPSWGLHWQEARVRSWDQALNAERDVGIALGVLTTGPDARLGKSLGEKPLIVPSEIRYK